MCLVKNLFYLYERFTLKNYLMYLGMHHFLRTNTTKMLRHFIILTMAIYSIDSYMAREYYEYKGQTGAVHRIPFRTMLYDWQEYIRKITEEYILEIEEYGLCNFNLDDYTQNISRNFFGYEINGLVNYTNGFIGTVQNIKIQNDMEMSWIDETAMISYIRSKFIIQDILLYYDYYAILATKNFGGTVAIPIEYIEFEIKIIKSYKTDEITVSIQNAIAKYPIKKRWFFEPTNKYTDIFNRDILWNFYDNLQKLANTTLNSLLNNVVKRNKYPDICFNCNVGMQLYEYPSLKRN